MGEGGKYHCSERIDLHLHQGQMMTDISNMAEQIQGFVSRKRISNCKINKE